MLIKSVRPSSHYILEAASTTAMSCFLTVDMENQSRDVIARSRILKRTPGLPGSGQK